MKKLNAHEIGKTILFAASACRTLADDISGTLSEDDKNMCSLIAHQLTSLFKHKLAESRDKLTLDAYIPSQKEHPPLTPIFPRR